MEDFEFYDEITNSTYKEEVWSGLLSISIYYYPNNTENLPHEDVTKESY